MLHLIKKERFNEIYLSLLKYLDPASSEALEILEKER